MRPYHRTVVIGKASDQQKLPGNENNDSQWISGDGEDEHGKWGTKGNEGAAKKLHDRHGDRFPDSQSPVS